MQNLYDNVVVGITSAWARYADIVRTCTVDFDCETQRRKIQNYVILKLQLPEKNTHTWKFIVQIYLNSDS